jgi:hypothetical protein
MEWLVSDRTIRTTCVLDYVAYTTLVLEVSFNIASGDICEIW